MSRRPIISLLLYFGLASCIDPVPLESIQYDNALVIEGYISTEFKAHEIKLSRTVPLNQIQAKPERNATVKVKDSEGSILNATEASPGIYQLPAFPGVVGRGYQLLIQTQDGKSYTSAVITLNDAPAIDRIYAEYPSREPFASDGIQLYVDSSDPDGMASYYRLEFEDTYEIQTPQTSRFVWLGGNNVNIRDFPIDRCWHSDTARNILIIDNSHQAEKGIKRFPIRFLPYDSRALNVKYSINVKQYVLSFEAYRFWKHLKQINESQGSLYDIQPGPVKGNIQSDENPNETVLGYFDAGAISSKRVFFVPRDLASSGFIPIDFFGVCGSINPAIVPFDQIGAYMEVNFLTQDIVDASADDQGVFYRVWPKTCCDCTRDGTNVMPSFWE